MSPLKTPEEKKNAVKWLLIQLKTFGVGFVACITAAWGVGEVYLEDYTRSVIDQVLEERKENKSFRQVLGEEMDIPSDLVPYHIVEKLNELDSIVKHLDQFENKYLPIIDFQQSIIPLYRYVEKATGQEYKMEADNRPHPIMYDENGKAWIVYGNRRKDL